MLFYTKHLYNYGESYEKSSKRKLCKTYSCSSYGCFHGYGYSSNSKIKVDYGYNPTDYVELGDYKGITADVDVTAITNKVVEDKISEQMDDQTTYTDVNRGAQKSDKVTFSYSGTSGGLAVDDFTGSDYSMVLGKDAFPVAGTELADELYDMVAGQTKVITVTMPDNSKYTDQAGKRVVFELSMSYVQQPNDTYAYRAFVKDTLS